MPRWIWPITVILSVIIASGTAWNVAGAISADKPPVIRTVTRVIKVTPKPKVIVRHHTKTITIDNPAMTTCIANLWHSYVSLANGGPAGDPSVFISDCPGVHINGLSG